MISLLPSRFLALNSLAISGVSCAVYCLTIFYFVMPDTQEFLLLFVIPFVGFMAINFLAVLTISHPLNDFAECEALHNADTQLLVNQIHRRLVFGLYYVLIPSAVVIHFLVMFIEDGGMQYLVDPDGWSLLINRISMIMLVGIVQSSVFDYVLSHLKHQWNFESVESEATSKLFNRLALMLLSIILFLGSSTPLFSTMRFDTYIDAAMPSMALNLDESEELESDLLAYSEMLQ